MSNDDFNMSMRKFLKQVGVTSQQAIEEAMRNGGQSDQVYAVKAVITIDGLDMVHEVSGNITGRDAT
ncbi:DUF6494 family protein [Yoonia litorea]|nr:DUF6494 family protein [Yoonia litorea]